jgi:hypothetical protein
MVTGPQGSSDCGQEASRKGEPLDGFPALACGESSSMPGCHRLRHRRQAFRPASFGSGRLALRRVIRNLA